MTRWSSPTERHSGGQWAETGAGGWEKNIEGISTSRDDQNKEQRRAEVGGWVGVWVGRVLGCTWENDRGIILTSVSAVEVAGSWDWIVGFGLDLGPNECLEIKDIHVRDHLAEGHQSATLISYRQCKPKHHQETYEEVHLVAHHGGGRALEKARSELASPRNLGGRGTRWQGLEYARRAVGGHLPWFFERMW
jgi:hypothetical protein